MFGAKKSDIHSARYLAMRSYRDTFDSLPDGAFFANAEQSFGFDVEDWGWFSEVEELNNK